MNENIDTQKQIAEHLRLAYKELRWAAQNIASIYELTKPENEHYIEDPRQLKLFKDE